ncbi:GNAT family N-acetyltransferase [Ciceribacter sp. L1K22]|uniref:GNAT family N-acetyltransferase n=1 Tax=Ciceribacter sp. L1K22 TaxID=2820275 RepID=UPI001ABE0112|nr:GNAT family N-acetyltransferase [Ciceribacter sp. L1K22]MBO3759880.1 GNAT family N-acetyltransferase [Ciceribacter sp. L1K22]
MASIRTAREDEADVLAEIGLRAWEMAMLSVGETRPMLENASRAFLNFTHSRWITISVVEMGGVPAGWAARERLDENITDFWIDPQYQRRGLGSALLIEVEEELRSHGFEKVALETHARNRAAVDFFEKHGYGVNWLTVSYNPKLDRDIQTIGLSKQLVEPAGTGYGQEF